MAVKSKQDVLKGIRRSHRSWGGKSYETFEIYFGTDEFGKKIRTSRPTMRRAREYVDEFFRSLDTNGGMLAALKPRDVLDAREALKMLAEAGMADVSLRQCAAAYVSGDAPGGARVREEVGLGRAFDLYLASIPEVQGHHRRCVEVRVGKWVDAFGRGMGLSDVSAREVAGYVAALGGAVKTRNNALNYIKSFMAWCAREERGWLERSPCASLRLEREAYRDPLFIAVDDMERLARAVEADFRGGLPFLVLSYWCGVRSDEIGRLMGCPQDVRHEEGSVRIAMPKGWTKGMRPRVVHLEENAVAWMRSFDIRGELAAAGSVDAMRRAVCRAGEAVEVEVKQNYGRHSYITYLTAKSGDPALAEAMAGTSGGMRSKHYDGLATRAEGVRYFSIMPSGE